MGHTEFLVKPAHRPAWFGAEEWQRFAETSARIVISWYEALPEALRSRSLDDCGDCDTLAAFRILQSGRPRAEKARYLASLWEGVGAVRLFFHPSSDADPLELTLKTEGPYDTLKMVKTRESPLADPLVSALFEAASAATGGALIAGADGCPGAFERHARTQALICRAASL